MNAQEKRLMALMFAASLGSAGCQVASVDNFDDGLQRSRAKVSGQFGEDERGAEVKVRKTFEMVKGLAGKVEAEFSETGKEMDNPDAKYLQTKGNISGTFYIVTKSGDVLMAVGPQIKHTYVDNNGNSNLKIENRTEAGLEAYLKAEKTDTQILASLRGIFRGATSNGEDLKYSQGRTGNQSGAVAQIELLQKLGYGFYTKVSGQWTYVDKDIANNFVSSHQTKNFGGAVAGVYYVSKNSGFYIGAFGAYEFANSQTNGTPGSAEQWKASLVAGYDLGRILWPNDTGKDARRLLLELEPYAQGSNYDWQRGHLDKNLDFGVQASLTIKLGALVDAIFGKDK